jgi:hypothetical protein
VTKPSTKHVALAVDAHPCDRPAVRESVFSLTALEGAYRRHQLRRSDYIRHRRTLLIRLDKALVEVYDLYEGARRREGRSEADEKPSSWERMSRQGPRELLP